MDPSDITVVDTTLIGRHNANLNSAQERLSRGQTYKDLSTIIVCPSRGSIPCAIVSCWMQLMRPMNQKVVGPLFAQRYEVGDAYSNLVKAILDEPSFRNWKYLLTIEEDNAPPPDGLLKLYESINSQEAGGPFDAVGGLYWTKGEGGQPMCYGNPGELPRNFIPFLPAPDTIARCQGLGMGFTLFRLSMLRDERLPKPLFRTVQQYTPGSGMQCYTQDLKFFEDAGNLGYRFACDSRCKVGHWEQESGVMW